MSNLEEFRNSGRPHNKGNDFKPLPEGWYGCVVDRVEERQSNAGDKMLAVSYKVTTEKYEGRLIFENLNLYHSTSEDAKHIALIKLWSISDAIGFNELPEDAQQFVGGPLSVNVVVEDHWSESDRQVNVVKKYKAVADADRPVEKPELPTKTYNKKPWEK